MYGVAAARGLSTPFDYSFRSMRRLGAFGRVRLNTQRTQLLLLPSTATRVQQFQKTTEQSEKRLTRYVTVLR